MFGIIYVIGMLTTLLLSIIVYVHSHYQCKRNNWTMEFDDREAVCLCFSVLFWPLVWLLVVFSLIIVTVLKINEKEN